MQKDLLRDRINFVLNKYGASVYSISKDDTERSRLTNQIKGSTTISSGTIEKILECFPDVSAEWLVRGEGVMERTKIIAPAPQNHQHIHSDGAPIAVTQSGDANVQAQKKEQAPEAPAPVNIDKMFREKDWNMVVSLIRQHDQEIIALKDQRIAELEQELSMLNALFKSVVPSSR